MVQEPVMREERGSRDVDEPVGIPIDGILDLHTFEPRDVKDLVPEYLSECRRRGILQVRIVHGKGSGALRETVHAVLSRLPGVESFRLADEHGGGWGATIVTLRSENG
ncbi:MAG: Smr/MutS family protein [bacterium]|nr:MAG: Smr/MutS family protein [bacterium]